MIWTTEIPTVPGYYWCRMHSLEFVTEIRLKEGHAFSYGFYHEEMLVSDTHGFWAGPIPKPTYKGYSDETTS